MKLRFFAMSAAMAAAVFSLSACGDKAAATSAAANSSASAPPMPKHLYAMKDGKEYGYEQELSEQDRNQGRATTSLLMFSYLGKKDGAYQVMLKDGKFRTVAECSMPCEYAKVYTFAADRFIKKEVMRITPQVIVASVFADAVNGNLDQLFGEQNGTAVTFWVDGEAKRLIVADAKTSGVVR